MGEGERKVSGSVRGLNAIDRIIDQIIRTKKQKPKHKHRVVFVPMMVLRHPFTGLGSRLTPP